MVIDPGRLIHVMAKDRPRSKLEEWTGLVSGRPGGSPLHRVGPEMFRVELTFADGERVTNRVPVSRWRNEQPPTPVLVPLSSRTELTKNNDRRRTEHRVSTTQWWVWPLPAPGTVEVRVDWPAEVLSGTATFDAGSLLETASTLR